MTLRKTKKAGASKAKRGAWEDPIVAEVRAVRDKLAAQFDYDIDRIFNHFRENEAKRRGREGEPGKAPTRRRSNPAKIKTR